MLILGIILILIGLAVRYLVNDALAVKIGTVLAVLGVALVVIDVLLMALGSEGTGVRVDD